MTRPAQVRGYGRVPKAAMFDDRLSPTEKGIFAVLSCFADDNGECFPGISTIAARAGCSEPTVKRALAKAISLGYLRRHRRHRQDGAATSNLYQVAWQTDIRAVHEIILGDHEITHESGHEITGDPHHQIADDPQTLPVLPIPESTNPSSKNIPPENTSCSPSPQGRKKANRFEAAYPADFEAWWEVFPNKVGKGKAFEVFREVREAGIPVDDLVRGVRTMIANRQAKTTAGVFAPDYPHPSTWLNQRRWEDPKWVNGADMQQIYVARRVAVDPIDEARREWERREFGR